MVRFVESHVDGEYHYTDTLPITSHPTIATVPYRSKLGDFRPAHMAEALG